VNFGAYVHFPWCVRKCPYCDFVSFEQDRGDIDHRGYADAVIRELDSRADDWAAKTLATVFFGGGTPSLWQPSELGRVLARLKEHFAHDADELEVSVECNPNSLDEARARALRDVGVNRLSVGVQGLDQERLAFLGRLHDSDEGLAAVRAALGSGMPRVSADLIYGVAGGRTQSPETAAAEAAAVAALGVEHVSAYALTIEPPTRFGELQRQGRLPIMRDEGLADSFVAVGAALAEHGLQRYEVSNFAKPGAHCRHNLGYWHGDDYLGLGVGAWGTQSRADGSALRERNPPTPEKYLAQVTNGIREPHERDELSPEARLRERIMLGLRLSEGLDLEGAAAPLGLDPWGNGRRERVDKLVEAERLERRGGHIRVPEAALLFADGIAAELF